jgi:hypothetical protein
LVEIRVSLEVNMRVLWCRIFGHKFYIDYFVPDGGYERGVSGIIRDTGTTVRKKTGYCTRCGVERAKLAEETRTVAQQTNGGAKAKS